MNREYETFSLHWNGIDIEIAYCRSWSPAYLKNYGYGMAHLECRAVTRLPITETGYRSHFTPAPDIDTEGGPVAFVQKWLDSEANSPEWLDYLEEQRQPSLF